MLEINNTDATSILSFFDELPDPRSKVNRLHLLGDVIVIAICGVLANADGPAGIEKWAKLNARWLKEYLQLPNDIPSRDTIRRVLTMLDPLEFQRCFAQWIDSLTFLTDEQKAEQKKHIAIDGKALRRSHDKKNGLGALFIVSAWASDRGITLGQMAIEEKSNEITAIPKLLDEIDLEDSIITIDAAGCQKNIAKQIVAGDGDYVLALKSNHPKLFEAVQAIFLTHFENDFAGVPVSRYEESETGHGRIEQRLYYQLTVPKNLVGRDLWAGLKTIGAAVRIYEQNGIEKSDVRYYLCSLRRNGKQFAEAVRSHWGIENQLHWCLDMAYREDESRVRNRNVAENLSWLRRLTLSLIKQHPEKTSNIMKRRMAGWSVDFLMQLLTGQYDSVR
jgi:predicted transposase YbfD/YdcC